MTIGDGNVAPVNSDNLSEDAPTGKSLLQRLFGVYEIVLTSLIILSIIGIAITDFSPNTSHRYWFAMVPVFAVACLVLEWSRARYKGLKWYIILQTQILHWVGVLVAMRLIYMLLHAGRLDNENTGLIILLSLALATFLAGIHLGWRLCVLGIFLAVALVAATYLEEYLWVLLIIAAAITAVFLAMRYLFGYKKEKEAG